MQPLVSPLVAPLAPLLLAKAATGGFPLSGNIVVEGAAAETLIGTLTAREAGSWTPTLTAGWAPNAMVALDGLSLETSSTPFDYEDGSEQAIKIDWTRSPDGEVRTVSYPLAVKLVLGDVVPTILEWSVDAENGDVLSATTGSAAGSVLVLDVISGQLGRAEFDGTDIKKTGGPAIAGDVEFTITETHPDAVAPHVSGPYTGAFAEEDVSAPATWDPVNKGSAVPALTNNDLTAGPTVSSTGAVRAIVGVQPGTKIYFELKATVGMTGNNRFGFVKSTFNLSGSGGGDLIGQTNQGAALTYGFPGQWEFRYASTNQALTRSGVAAAGSSFPANSAIGVAIDTTGGGATWTVTFYNASGAFDPVTIPSGFVWYPAAQINTTVAYTAFFDPATFTYTIPADHTALMTTGSGALTSSALVHDAIGAATAGDTISIGPSVVISKLTLSNENYDPPVTIRFTGEEADRPTFQGINLTNCSGFVFSNVAFTRDPTEDPWTSSNPTSQAIKLTGCSEIEFFDISVDPGSVRHADGAGVNTREGASKGSGYLVGDKFVFSGGGGSGAEAHVSAVDGAGAITGVVLDAIGSGYTSTPSVTITNAAGGATTGSGAVLQPYLGPIDHMGAFGTWQSCDNIRVYTAKLRNCSAGINLVACHDIVLDHVNIRDHYADGIDYSDGTYNVDILDLDASDMYAVPYDHLDLIQGNTQAMSGAERFHHINVERLKYARGLGAAAQIVFFGDELNNGTMWYEDISILDCDIRGAAYNAIVLASANAEVRRNFVQAYSTPDALGATYSSWIKIGGTGVRLTDNQSDSFVITGHALNVVDAVFVENSGNVSGIADGP